MNVVDLSQEGDDWLEWRRNGITATDAAILVGLSPYKTRWRLWAEKTGYAREVDLSLNPLVRRGVENEDIARRAFEEKHNDLLLSLCVESVATPLMRASLDGLNSQGEPVELKCPSGSVWEEVCAEQTNSKAYRLYYPQVQHQLLVTGATRGWLVFYFDGQIQEFLILRDETMIQQILAEAQVFWQQVKDKKEPDKNPEKDLFIPHGKEIDIWITAAESYRLYESEIQEIKQRLVQLQERQKPHVEMMKSLMGEYLHADYCGVLVTRYKVAGRIDYKKLLDEKVSGVKPEDLDHYREKSSDRCRITVTGSVKPRYIVDEDVLAPLNDRPEEVETFYW
ncbi:MULTISPECIES: YqaJ viral recombinase family protein [Edwardsiella]|uniref:Putative phage-type endonuclease n=1 Tax=Edwardsiella anguillarum ET080813 TaxID=667120 RepID=A0A076LVJ3_9GAMM|nr:YqaJ viral recombinase family protein [Edwardsiella anguillarum]EGA8339129.1 endonuclease [Salmonella enterica subsp. enterica serovar Saintpaul]EKG9744442.1 YqaJ viral recombinase family protein [Salmonella enterica]NJS89697.1 endonuclease [Escherichia coli]AIJ10687.1 putative phage-type endonuclease [Edwardsiella anguillarum ET080813]ELA2338786.1 YqaJ viral recombinase family protein [Salmonella enterica]